MWRKIKTYKKDEDNETEIKQMIRLDPGLRSAQMSINKLTHSIKLVNPEYCDECIKQVIPY